MLETTPQFKETDWVVYYAYIDRNTDKAKRRFVIDEEGEWGDDIDNAMLFSYQEARKMAKLTKGSICRAILCLP